MDSYRDTRGASLDVNQSVPEPWSSAMLRAGLLDPHRKDPVPSINRLAEKAGIAPETVRRMIRGLGDPDPANVALVADALDYRLGEVSKWVDQAREVMEPYSPPVEAALMNREERTTVDRLIRLLVTNRRSVDSAKVTRIRPPTAAEIRERHAARKHPKPSDQ